jgi:hypothetical protein
MRRIKYWPGILILAAAGSTAEAAIVTFDYSLDTSGFFTANGAAKASLEAAGEFLGSRLADTLDSIVSAGNDHFNARLWHPATGNLTTLSDYSVAADTLVVFVGARDLGGSLGIGGPGGWTASGSSAFFSTVRTRGEGDTSNTDGNVVPAVDFAPWGGSISFGSTAAWYFDPDPSSVESFPGLNDFHSVALHELGHVLGFGLADSWQNKVSGNSFVGAHAMAAYGGSAVPLSGDSAHWQEGIQSLYLNDTQETLMDPSLLVGSRKYFTNLDLAALADIGWEVVPVPLPPAALLFLSGVAVLAIRRR